MGTGQETARETKGAEAEVLSATNANKLATSPRTALIVVAVMAAAAIMEQGTTAMLATEGGRVLVHL